MEQLFCPTTNINIKASWTSLSPITVQLSGTLNLKLLYPLQHCERAPEEEHAVLNPADVTSCRW